MARKTALYDRHVALGARMVDFAGWMLPVQYPAGPKEEHLAVRRAAGLFDIDHMGQVRVSGSDARRFLQDEITTDVVTIEVWHAGYSLLCYDDGTVVDDTFIYHLPDGYLVAVNAANIDKDMRWLEAHAYGYAVDIVDISPQTYMLALQGPAAEGILQGLCDRRLSRLRRLGALSAKVAGVDTLIGRTGYTGEDGFELYFDADRATLLWDSLLEQGKDAGLVPCGLAARDSLRLEPCMPLYGQEISADVSPFESGLSWAVDLDKGAFLGRDALLKAHLEGVARRLVAFEMVDRGVPRHGYDVAIDGRVSGVVTSGGYSPSLDKFIGLAYVPREHSRVGMEIGIAIRDQVKRAVIVKKPFYVPAYRR